MGLNEGNGTNHEAVVIDGRIASLIDGTVPQVFQKEHIISFLRTAAENYLQDYRNLILIWRQRENAGMIVGKEALNKEGIELPETVKPVTLLYPMVVCVYEGRLKTERDGTPVMEGDRFVYLREPEFQLRYQPVAGNDLTDVSDGRIPQKSEEIDIFNAVRGNISFVVEEDDGSDFLGNGVVDYVNERFLLRKGLSDRERDRTMLELFVDHSVEMVFKQEPFFKERLSESGCKVLPFLLKGAVLSRFDLLKGEFSLMPLTETEKMEAHELKDLLMCFADGLQAVLGVLCGNYLTFDETALCNSLLRQNEDGSVLTGLFDTAFPFRKEDACMDHEMRRLSGKLVLCDEGRLKELCCAVRDQRLTTYPLYYLVQARGIGVL